MISQGHSCTAYGLRFRSEIALPFPSAPRDEPPDVTIRLGAVPEVLAAPGVVRRDRWQALPGAFLLDIEGTARYLVTAGREIAVEPTGGDEAAVRTYLAGSVLAACLQQRGVLTMHAASVATETGAVLFAGPSGSGKSTLLAALVERGYAMLADDVTGILVDARGRATALPAFPAVRLRPDAVDALAWRAKTLDEAPHEGGKHVVPVEPFHATPLAVRTVVALVVDDRDSVAIASVSRDAAVGILFRNSYRRQYLAGLGGWTEYLRGLAVLARQACVSRLARPARSCPATWLADEVERHLRADGLGVGDVDSAPAAAAEPATLGTSVGWHSEPVGG